MSLKIRSVALERFRALRALKIEGLGRVNLITGRNNTGKSSVLEALRILAEDADPMVIYNILRDREEDLFGVDEDPRGNDMDSLSLLSTLFHGFPELADTLDPIVIAANGGPRAMEVSMRVGWFSEEHDSDGNRRLVSQQSDLFGEPEGRPALLVETGGVRRILTLRHFLRSPYRSRPSRPDLFEEQRMPCVFVSPYGGKGTAALGALWDRIALSDRERDVVDALKVIDPQISAVSMVGGEGPKRSRTAIVRADNIARPVPLRSYGDGLNRLFGIILSLVNSQGGLLLVDEFENGMHHTVQLDAWRTVFRLAEKLDIQVFATSHSWDAIEAFQLAAAETPEEGVLIRLARKGEDLVPTVFAEDELAVATRERIEVR